jgi:hypothetical protein
MAVELCVAVAAGFCFARFDCGASAGASRDRVRGGIGKESKSL